MLRGNLSTRPFYNERLVTLVLVLVAVVTAALAVFNVTQIMSLSAERAGFKANEQRNNAEASRIRGEASTLAKTVDPSKLKYLSTATREANYLIDQRTFSWTAFFGYVEKTLPLDARLLAVSPRVEKGEFKIAMIVMGRRRSDLKDFTDHLMQTGAFYDIGPTSDMVNDDGTVTATIVGTYLMAPEQPNLKPAPGKKPATPPRRGRP
jgi:hypothetical protein